MGRRTLAWIADLLLFLAVVAAGFASMSEYTEIPTAVPEEEACELFEQQNPGAADSCVAFDGDIYLLDTGRSEEHTSELQSLMRISYAVFCLKKKNTTTPNHNKS